MINLFDLSNKNALITGGGTGIGKGIAELFAQQGCHVSIVGRRETKLQEVQAEIGSDKCDYHVADLRNEEDIQRVVRDFKEKHAKIDIFVANAGIYRQDSSTHTVGEDGRFLNIVPKFKRRFVKDAEKDIIEDLKNRHILFKKEKIEHAYPFCWRCNTPVEYIVTKQWFIL